MRYNQAVTKRSLPRKLLIIAVVLLLLQIPWYAAIQLIVDKTLVKTMATVISEGHYSSGCTESLCDHSAVIAPIYAYKAENGKTYTQSDQYLGGYKQNNPLIHLFGRKVGDKVTAYYSKDNPNGATFMTGPLAYTAFLIPLYFAIIVALVAGIAAIYGYFYSRRV